jgi:hypothetical protein
MNGMDRFDWNLNRLTELAVEAGLLSAGSRGHEITQRVIWRGVDSLSPGQRVVYLAEAVPVLNEMLRRQFTRERSDNDAVELSDRNSEPVTSPESARPSAASARPAAGMQADDRPHRAAREGR